MRSGREIRFDGPLLRGKPEVVALGKAGRLDIAVPKWLPAGPIIADVVLLDGQGKVLTWGRFATRRPQAATLSALSVSKPAVKPNEPFSLSLKVAAHRVRAVRVEAKLIDAFGRVVDAVAQDEQLAAAMYGLALGSEAFVARIRQMVKDRGDDAAVPQLSALRSRPSFDAVVTEAARLMGDAPAA